MKLLTHAALRTLLVSAAIAGATWALSIFVRFGEPSRLWYAAVPCVLFACWTGYSVWRQRAIAALGHPATLASLTVQQSPVRQGARAALLVLSALMAVYAFAVPQWGEESRQVERRGIDVVLAVDVSRSMLADDVPPDRLQAAIGEIETLLNDLKGDRVGLVVYAGVAFTQSPLTSDYGATRLYLNRLNPSNIPVQGTAIGRAIAEGKKLLTGGTNDNFKRAQHQMMIIVSDGEDHETNPVAAAQQASDEGIRVFTVGVGSEDGARIPVRDQNGNLREYLTDRNGQVVVTKLQDEQLREIARAGGGQYIRYSGEGSVAAELSRAVDSFDDEALSSVLRAEYVDRPMFFLIPSAVFLLAFLMLGGVRRRRTQIALFALCLIASGCSGIERNDPAVEEAVEASKGDEHERAVSQIEQANDEAREQGAYWFDRGLIYERAEQADEALDAYLHALGTADGSLRGDSLVGIGNTLFAQEQFAEARDRYERALRLNPDHAAARRNLEIALRREFPPCRELDDEYEDNDEKDSATAIPETALVGDFAPKGMQLPGGLGAASPSSATPGADPENAPTMVSCGGDDDYYAIPVHGGDAITVTATFRRLRDDTGGPPLPDEIEPMDVRLALLSPDGEEILAVDQGLEDASEAVDAKRVSRRIADVPVPLEYGQDGAVLLLVETNQPLEFEYELEVSVIPPCRALEDEFEENDSRSSSRPIESGDHKAMACVDDPDWYSVSVEAGDDLFVDVEPGVSTTREPVMMLGSIAASPDAPELTEVPTQPEILAGLEARSISQSGALPFSVEGVDGAEGQYPFSVYHYPPCPVGRDRHEPNDAAGNASPLTAEDAPVRHLRLCEGDEDWFRFTLPPESDDAPTGDDEDVEPEPIPFSALASFEDSSRDVIVELYDVDQQRLIGTSQNLRTTPGGQTQGVADPAAGASEDDAPSDEASAPATHPGESIAAALLPPGTTEVLVRVGGAQSYYHLSFPDTEAQQQEQQQSDGSDSDESQSDGEPDDSDGDEESQEPQDEEQSSEDESDDESQGQNQPAEQTEEEAKREALMQLLNALEDDEVNLQLQQALDDLPPIQMRDEW